MAARVQPRHHLCYQPNCRGLQQDCDGTSTTLQISTHWSASQCSYHCANRTFPATIQPEEGKLGAVGPYAYQLDAAAENNPATAECYDQFVNALRKVARKNIPRGCRRNYVPGLTPESIELIKEYREKYEDDPFADITITLGEELVSAISEERGKAWQTLIESTDLTHNSKKAWSTIRKLCDDPCKPKQHCNTTANQVAHQLLLNGRVPNRQQKVRLDRQRYPDDPGFTRAFTAAELDIGIRVLKKGKSPGLDNIQTELIKQFGPKARDWLLRFFNNCTETKKIPKIWRQAKEVALLKPGKEPIRCEELPTDLPALPHLQAVRTTHTEPDSRARGRETYSRTSRISSGKIVYEPATEPDGAHRRWL